LKHIDRSPSDKFEKTRIHINSIPDNLSEIFITQNLFGILASAIVMQNAGFLGGTFIIVGLQTLNIYIRHIMVILNLSLYSGKNHVFSTQSKSLALD